MSEKLGWIDNLRGLACLMVVLIHATTFYVVGGVPFTSLDWSVANLLNSASRVAVPLFFMISGFLFFGTRQASKKQFLRLGCCLLFYSALALLYIGKFSLIGFWPSLKVIVQKPVFYHLWFFYAIGLIYLLSPLINLPPVSGRYLALLLLLLGILANPNTPKLAWHGVTLLPINLYIYGDTFYYLLYALAGRAIAMLGMPSRRLGWLAGGLFVLSVLLIASGTYRHSLHNNHFFGNYYSYAGPWVFSAAVSLLIWAQRYLQQARHGLAFFSRHSLAIYGLHAIFISMIFGLFCRQKCAIAMFMRN